MSLERRRRALGLTQAQLAERVGLSRQALVAIERGQSRPGVDVALRLARILGASVETLFADSATTCARAVGSVAERATLVHAPAGPVAFPTPLDRVSGRVLARRGRELDVADGGDPLVVAGCAPILALVGAHARAVGLDVLVVAAGSGRALELVRRAHAHVAGVHVAPSTRAHAELAAARFGPAVAVGGVRWEVGVLSTRRVRSLASIGDDPGDGRRLASRERGSGARARLDAWFPTRSREAVLELGSHEDVARAVRWGAADLGVAIAPVAREHELAFVALDDEPFDLVLPEALLSDARVSRLLDTLGSAALRDEIARLGGYDVRDLGAVQRAA